MGCGKSKHSAIEHSISRKSSEAGSKTAKAPETTIGKVRKLERNASTLMAEDGRNVISRKKSRAVHDENGVAEGTESKKHKKIHINDHTKDKKNGDAEMGCEVQKCDATENTMNTKNSRVGMDGGEIPEIRIEEVFELYTETSSSMKEEGQIDRSSGGDNSVSLADENVIIIETKESDKRGNTLETIDETRDRDSDSTLLMKEEDKNVEKDSKLVENAKEDTLEDKKLAENAKEDSLDHKKLAETAEEDTANDEPETMKGENLEKV